MKTLLKWAIQLICSADAIDIETIGRRLKSGLSPGFQVQSLLW